MLSVPFLKARAQQPPSRTSGHRPAVVAREDFHQDKLPLSVREKQLLSLVRDCPASHQESPDSPGSHPKRAEAKELPGERKRDLGRRITGTGDKSRRKRKVRGGGWRWVCARTKVVVEKHSCRVCFRFIAWEGIHYAPSLKVLPNF